MKNVPLFSCLVLAILMQVNVATAQTGYPLNDHPRLFLLTQDESVLKNKLASTPVLNSVHELIISEADKMLDLSVQQRVLTGKRLLSVSREAIRRISFLSYAYRMSGQTKYATRAETEMLAMANFSDWNPSHFLDVAEMTLAMSIGYDWLYNYMGSTSKTLIASAIKSKGIERSTGSYANQSWLTGNNNWNQVCNAGISAGVAAVYDEDPAYYQTLIDRAVTSIQIPMGVYKYNGAYPEGMGYWDYGTTFNVLFIDMLQRMWGTDRQLLSVEGFLSTVNFVTHIQGNGTKQMSSGTLKDTNPLPFNFADCGSGIGVLPGMFWLAGQAGNTNCLYGEMKKLEFNLTGSPSSLTGNRLLPMLLIWSMNLKLNDLPAPSENTYVAQGKSAVAALRAGWQKEDIYLAIKGGTPNSNHAHMDVGSFVMEANDIRWAFDFGSSDYNTLETNGVDLWNMSQTSERWDVFRYNNFAHSTLTFNGNKQLMTGSTTIDNLVYTNDLKSVEMNLTSLYQNDVENCKRTGSVVANRYVEIKDEISAKSSALPIRWTLVTKAVPQKVSNKIIKLSQSSKNLYLIFDGDDNVQARAWSTKPSNSFEEQNTDFYLTGYEFTMPAGESRTITVKMVPEGDPLLDGLSLNTAGEILNEDFEAFSIGSLSNDFVSWKLNPASNGTLKAVLGEVTGNPYKSGINQSEKVLKIVRQDDSGVITSSNAGNYTYRGAQAYGYNLRLNSNSVVEFKYYKNEAGKVGIRVYDGNGNMVLVDFSDPYEQTNNYSTAQWRTAQFEIGTKDLTNFSYTASGYLLISPERNGTELYQEKALIIYVDDVKLLPLNNASAEPAIDKSGLYAFFDKGTSRIYVKNLPQWTTLVRLYNAMGAVVGEVTAMGTVAIFKSDETASRFYIVQVLKSNGQSESVKLMK